MEWVGWALGAIVSAWLGGAGASRWVAGAVDKAIEKVRRDGEAERDALWERFNRHVEEDEKIHRDAERFFASKDDIRDLKTEIANSKAEIISAIGGRGSIRERL